MPVIRLIIAISWCLLLASPVQSELPSLKMLILMPGPVIEAHAEEEKNCDSCHGDFDKSAQKKLCLDCHENVSHDQVLKEGFHGRSSQALNSSCKSCHKDHKGRGFNSIPLDRDTFDHISTDFELSGRHVGVSCNSCHAANDPFHEAPLECDSCHNEVDPHRGGLGDDCASCHSEQGWTSSEPFDHEQTEFSLKGAHKETACAGCHAGQHYEFESTQCLSCHQVQDVHLGRYGEKCDRCHSETEWSSPLFDHEKETDYTLTGAHSEQACRACHVSDFTEKSISTECVSCHRAGDIHAGRHGDSCDDCHKTSDWETTRFDHAKESNWPLLGKHEDLACIACHAGELQDEVSTDCKSCHQADSVHGDERLEECSVCHQSSSWSRTSGFDHELTHFPLEGMHAIALCQTCHVNNEFHTAETACLSCHENEDVHEKTMGEDCAQCHSPNSWALWNFDHDKQTKFDLVGAHEELSCDSCHIGEPAKETSQLCSSCHAEDDRHAGGFGSNCGRCHGSDTFEGVQWSR